MEGKTYRLPTEAEWEYACRAGTETAWSFGNDVKVLGDYAWYDKNAWDIGEQYAHQVELKKPNAFGLYDMHGNVFEWCKDFCGEDYYHQLHEKDPQGPTPGDLGLHVLRGGSWGEDARITRAAHRYLSDDDANDANADNYLCDVGFRLVRELD